MGNIGVAVDLGTTTIAVEIYDLDDKILLSSSSFINPQVAHGADVITRMTYILRHERGLKKLREMVTLAINDSIVGLLDKLNLEVNDIDSYVIAGNTTMSHIFLGMDISGIAAAPFEPAYTGGVNVKAKKAGLLGKKETNVYVVPNIAGHVGGDITAGILAIGLMEGETNHLFIDIGTNGEIVLKSGDRVFCASTAAGPAFEGRGGIYGSSIIDIIDLLLKRGIIDKTGNMVGDSYTLSKDVAVYQEDVRAIQLAKAAVLAGCLTLLNEAGIGVDDLDRISIGGTFGSFINPQSAMNIGLLPRVNIEKIKFCGNTSGMGAAKILLDKKEKKKASAVAKKVLHIELADREDFSGLFMGNMIFDNDLRG